MSALHSPRSFKRRADLRAARYTPRNVKAVTGIHAVALQNIIERRMGWKKRDLMAQARRAGWTGKSYRTAKKFERKLERWRA